MITSTGNVVLDLLHNFHLECGARLHKLRVYETLSDPTGREVCGYLLVRGSVHAHAYALALKKITGVELEKMLPVPNIPLGNIPECQKYLAEGAHRRLYTFSPSDYREMSGIWGQGEQALPDDPPGELIVVDGMPEGGKVQQLTGIPSAFTPDYAPERCSRSRPSSTRLRTRAAVSLDRPELHRRAGRTRYPRISYAIRWASAPTLRSGGAGQGQP
jgi:Mn-containing catalase